jgi:hypothetical protein
MERHPTNRGQIMRLPYLLAGALVLSLAPTAFADSIQYSVSTSFLANVYSPNDNYYGYYHTGDPTSSVTASIGEFRSTVDLSAYLFYLPEGSLVTAVSTKVIVPTITTLITGTGYLFHTDQLGSPTPGEPSIAPTFSQMGSSTVFVRDTAGKVQYAVNANEVSFGDSPLYFDLGGTIHGVMTNPGSNWSGYIGGNGQVTIPYTVELDVTYTIVPIPEPSTLALLSTGMLGMLGVVRRKIFNS